MQPDNVRLMAQPAFAGARTIARATPASDLLWKQAMREVAGLIDTAFGLRRRAALPPPPTHS